MSALEVLYAGATQYAEYSRNGGALCYAFTPLSLTLAQTALLTLVAFATARHAMRSTCLPSTTKQMQPRLTARAMQMCLVVLFAYYSLIHATRKTLIFMLQPCHLGGALFTVPLSGRVSAVAKWCAAFALSNAWGYAIALLMPDAGASPGSVFTVGLFYVHHGLIAMVVPAYLATASPMVALMCGSWRWRVVIASVAVIYHTLFLMIVCLATGANINYMLCPPVIVDVLPLAWRPHYRVVSSVVGFLLSYAYLWLLSVVPAGVALAGFSAARSANPSKAE